MDFVLLMKNNKHLSESPRDPTNCTHMHLNSPATPFYTAPSRLRLQLFVSIIIMEGKTKVNLALYVTTYMYITIYKLPKMLNLIPKRQTLVHVKICSLRYLYTYTCIPGKCTLCIITYVT